MAELPVPPIPRSTQAALGSVCRWALVDVGTCAQVPVNTMGCHRTLPCTRPASLAVYLMGNGLYVDGIQAEDITAEMVRLGSFGERPNKRLVGVAVNKHLSASNVEVAVPIRVSGRCPHPASIWSDMNLTPEAEGK